MREKGIEVVGVSSDTLPRQKKFAEKLGVPFKLVADPNMIVIKAYDVVGKTGKSALRVTYIIEISSHKIVKVFYGLRKAEEHVDETTRFITSLI